MEKEVQKKIYLSIELFKGKKLKNKTYPLLFRLYSNGNKKYKASGISTLPKYWNANKRRLTCREDDYKSKNDFLIQEYNRITERIKWFVNNNIEFDLEFILSNLSLESYESGPVANKDFDSSNFIDIMKMRANSRTRFKTRENNKCLCNTISKLYNQKITTSSINQLFVNNFRSKVDQLNSTASLKNSLLLFFKSSYEFGVLNKWIKDPYNFKIKLFHVKRSNNREMPFEEITEIINAYKIHLMSERGFCGCFGLSLFILDMSFQGLSPFDLSNLKIKDLELIEIKKNSINYERYKTNSDYKRRCDLNQEYKLVLKIKAFRSKTNIEVPICTDIYPILPIIYYLVQNKSKNDYLLNCYSKNKTYTENQLHIRSEHYFQSLSKDLNKTLIQYNNTHLTSIRKLTFYYARHCFINYLDHMNISRHLIRKMIGHKQNSLDDYYINRITDWEQATIIGQMFNSNNPIKEILLKKYGKDEIEKQIKYIFEILR